MIDFVIGVAIGFCLVSPALTASVYDWFQIRRNAKDRSEIECFYGRRKAAPFKRSSK